MLLEPVVIFTVLVLGLSPSLVYWWLRRQAESRLQNPLGTPQMPIASRRWRFRNFPPDTRYIEGVGFLIGDITCKYNARSSHMRCAVNPQGPCQGCPYYEMQED
ncbi:MAG: DUF6464 family protein [Microcoleaceae cyanobacterium]